MRQISFAAKTVRAKEREKGKNTFSLSPRERSEILCTDIPGERGVCVWEKTRHPSSTCFTPPPLPQTKVRALSDASSSSDYRPFTVLHVWPLVTVTYLWPLVTDTHGSRLNTDYGIYFLTLLKYSTLFILFVFLQSNAITRLIWKADSSSSQQIFPNKNIYAPT